MMFRYRVLTSLLAVVVLPTTACSRQHEPSRPRLSAETPFQEAILLGEVVALSDGAAYLTNFFGGTYYIRAGVAKRVEVLPTKVFGELTPLADGSALFTALHAGPARLYWLQGAKAVPVQEGETEQLVGNQTGTAGFFFAENQRLRRQLGETEVELASDGFDEPPPDGEREYP